jgi:hypothetical protein
LGIVWPFIAVVLFQALLGASAYVLSAVRGYVAGESLWSKGQKDAIYYLNLYADSRDEAIFLKYQDAIAVPQGGHQLRLALDRQPPDLQAARGFSRVATTRMTFQPDLAVPQFPPFQLSGNSHRPLDHRRCLSGQLDNVARRCTRASRMARGRLIQHWKAQIFAINDGVTPAAKAFSDALGEGSRMILRLLLFTNLATALGLIALACCAPTSCSNSAMPSPMPAAGERPGADHPAIDWRRGDHHRCRRCDCLHEPGGRALTHWKAEQAAGLLGGAVQSAGRECPDRRIHADRAHSQRPAQRWQRTFQMIQRLDGSTVSVTLVGAPIRNAGKVSGAVLVLHDMTQERQYIANLSWQATHDPDRAGQPPRVRISPGAGAAHLTRQPGRHA